MGSDGVETVILSEEECVQLLRDLNIGRLAWVTDSGQVAVLPVNYAMDGNDVIFCTSKGLKLSAIHAGTEFAFQVDDVEPAARTGRSVLMHGHAEEVTDPDEARRLADLVRPWRDRPHVVRLHPYRITGRLIPAHAGGVSVVHIAADGSIG